MDNHGLRLFANKLFVWITTITNINYILFMSSSLVKTTGKESCGLWILGLSSSTHTFVLYTGANYTIICCSAGYYTIKMATTLRKL